VTYVVHVGIVLFGTPRQIGVAVATTKVMMLANIVTGLFVIDATYLDVVTKQSLLTRFLFRLVIRPGMISAFNFTTFDRTLVDLDVVNTVVVPGWVPAHTRNSKTDLPKISSW
jgi:hypothetical protein